MLILVRGPSGSGKSTFAKKLCEVLGGSHLEADMYFCLEGTYNFKPELLPKAHQWCLDCTKLHLSQNKVVVVSNTFTRIWEMQNYLDLGVSRVYRCNKEYPNIHGVPKEIVMKQKARMEDYPNEQRV